MFDISEGGEADGVLGETTRGFMTGWAKVGGAMVGSCCLLTMLPRVSEGSLEMAMLGGLPINGELVSIREEAEETALSGAMCIRLLSTCGGWKLVGFGAG